MTIQRLEIPNLTVDGGEERRDLAAYDLWPGALTVSRYSYRGNKIPAPWPTTNPA